MHDRADRVTRLADAVRRRRVDLGLRQEEVADLADCSERFVHSVEAGKITIRLDKLLDVLDVLGLTLEVARGHGNIGVSSDLPLLTKATAPDRPQP